MARPAQTQTPQEKGGEGDTISQKEKCAASAQDARSKISFERLGF